MSEAENDSFFVRFETLHCTMVIDQPAPGLARVTISGHDAGELADAPFRALETLLDLSAPLRLFIDARSSRGASVEVSGDWALWLREHRGALAEVTMLTGSKFVRITADFVRGFAELGELMRITTDPAAFDEALAAAIG